MAEKVKDQIIWDEFLNGSQAALEFIYEDNYSALYYYGNKFTKDNDLIKDLIHELFIELIDSGRKLSKTNNIRFYLLKALRNKLLKQLSKKSIFTDSSPESSSFNIIESVENKLINEEISEESRNSILGAIKKISVKQQEIIYLRFYNDLSYQEIAVLFNVEIQTVRNLISRAIKSLKNEFVATGINKQLILFVLGLSI
ncbi:MAG: sigma-70 family RNA polymerase sigma factor [Prolixibacteraceae bacterium]